MKALIFAIEIHREQEHGDMGNLGTWQHGNTDSDATLMISAALLRLVLTGPELNIPNPTFNDQPYPLQAIRLRYRWGFQYQVSGGTRYPVPEMQGHSHEITKPLYKPRVIHAGPRWMGGCPDNLKAVHLRH